MTSPDSETPGPSSSPWEPTPPVRASDADREAVVGMLHDAVVRGLLTPEEGQERVAAAYAARFLQDLPLLTADLPPAPAPAPAAPGWRALLLLVWLQVRSAVTRDSLRSVVRTPRRLVVAAVALLVVLSLAGMADADVFERDRDDYRHGVEWDYDD